MTISVRHPQAFFSLLLLLCIAPHLLHAQSAAAQPQTPVPEWAQPGSATHRQVPPPADFHRPSRNYNVPIGIFQGQSDIGAAVVSGSASYDARTKQYTICSAGYNIWYSRDEFRFLWKKMSGNISLAMTLHCSSAWKVSPCTNSGRPSTFISTVLFTWASASPLTCLQLWTQPYFPTRCSRIPRSN